MSNTNIRRAAAKQSFLEWAAWLRYSSPLCAALAQACAVDADMAELGTAARPGQPIAMIVLLSAHFLLLKSPQSTLGDYFPSITPDPKPPSQAFSSFKEFCLDHRGELITLIESRTVNSTMVDRSSCILPALAHVSRLLKEPLTLVEICCSAGLNLLFDEYHYDYGDNRQLGSESSPVRLNCKVIGNAPLPIEAIPMVHKRIGVDLVRVDAADPLQRLWMEAMLCPEWTTEREHLRSALAVRASRPFDPFIGDALEVLPTLLSEVSGPLCILHTYCMGQWSAESRLRLDQLLREASRHRDIHRIGLDIPESESPDWFRTRLTRLASAGVPLLQKSFPSQIEHTWYSDTQAERRLLGEADGFGSWIDWR